MNSEVLDTTLYPLNEKEESDLDNRFSYHKPISDQSERYEEIRGSAKQLAKLFMLTCPRSRELSLALTNLEQSVMWANASIARNETEGE